MIATMANANQVKQEGVFKGLFDVPNPGMRSVPVEKAEVMHASSIRAQPTVKLNIRGEDWEVQFDPYDRGSMYLLCMIALENSKVDAVLKAFGVKVCNDQGECIWPK